MNLRAGGGDAADDVPVQEYAVYVNRAAEGKRALLLMFPHKLAEEGFRPVPQGLRIKPAAGLVEVDLPLNVQQFYDGERASKFAQGLQASRAAQTGADHGLAGGFGASTAAGTSAPRSATKDAATNRVDGESAEDAEGVRFLTLGGRVQISTDHDAPYMIGVFREGELHMTPVDAVCSLRPQFHHLDALADNEKVASRGASGDNAAQDSEARAVNMAVKSTEDEELDMGEVGRTLRSIQEEPWQRLEWVDEDDLDSYAAFDNELQVHDEQTRDTCLLSALTEKQYEDVASAPRIEPMNQGKRVLSVRPWSDGEDSGKEDKEEPEVKPVVSTGKRKAQSSAREG